MKLKSLITALTILLMNVTLAAQDWGPYVPEKGRGETIKKSRRASGSGLALSTNLLILTYWVSDSVARALVSRIVDRQRLTSEETEKHYMSVRNNEQYVFLLEVGEVTAGYSRGSLKASANPLSSSEIFLQRADNRKEFVKGQIKESDYDYQLGSGKSSNTYLLTFPKTTRDGQPLIRSIDDRIEIQVSIKGKVVILEYKLKDLVSRIEDL